MAFTGYEVDSLINFEPLIDGEFYCLFPNDKGINILDIGNGINCFPAKDIDLSLGEPVIETIELQQGLSVHIPTKITNVKSISMNGIEGYKNEILAFLFDWVMNPDLEAMRVPDMRKYAKDIQVFQYSNGNLIFDGAYSIIPNTSLQLKVTMSFNPSTVIKNLGFYIIKTYSQNVNGVSKKPFDIG